MGGTIGGEARKPSNGRFRTWFSGYIGASRQAEPRNVTYTTIGMDISALKPWTEIRVTWRDAYAPHSGWHEVDDYEPEEATAITIGRYWPDCQEHYLTVAGTVFDNDSETPKTVGDINHIPLGWILKIEVINAQQTYP